MSIINFIPYHDFKELSILHLLDENLHNEFDRVLQILCATNYVKPHMYAEKCALEYVFRSKPYIKNEDYTLYQKLINYFDQFLKSSLKNYYTQTLSILQEIKDVKVELYTHGTNAYVLDQMIKNNDFKLIPSDKLTNVLTGETLGISSKKLGGVSVTSLQWVKYAARYAFRTSHLWTPFKHEPGAWYDDYHTCLASQTGFVFNRENIDLALDKFQECECKLEHREKDKDLYYQKWAKTKEVKEMLNQMTTQDYTDYLDSSLIPIIFIGTGKFIAHVNSCIADDRLIENLEINYILTSAKGIEKYQSIVPPHIKFLHIDVAHEYINLYA